METVSEAQKELETETETGSKTKTDVETENETNVKTKSETETGNIDVIEAGGTRVVRSEVTAELSQIESFSPHILEATLRNTSWESIMRDFFRTNSPRFEGFRKTLTEGNDFDIQMMSVYNDYMEAVEIVIRNQIKIIGVTEEKFVAATSRGLSSADPVSVHLVEYLENHSDFYDFGRMMEDKYLEEYGTKGGVTASVGTGGVGKSGSTSTVHCRVLWDIENIGVGKKLGGLATIDRIQGFLRSKGLYGSGIDCRITAFFNPAHKSNVISKKVVNELDKAAVEIVWVSEKREDADRKLGNRISQELQVLSPQNTTFVIITSDQDFRHHFQQLRNLNYSILVIHNAPADSKWSTTLAMHCSASYHWKEVLAGGRGNQSDDVIPPASGAVVNGGTSNSAFKKAIQTGGEDSPQPSRDSGSSVCDDTPLPPGWEMKFDPRTNKCFFVNHTNKSTHWADPRHGDGVTGKEGGKKNHNNINKGNKKKDIVNSEEEKNTFMKEMQSIWLSGVCKKWKSTFGFVKVVNIADTPQIEGVTTPISDNKDPTSVKYKYAHDLVGRDIFVHSSHLPAGFSVLDVGDTVEMQIAYTKKGLQASAVRSCTSVKGSATEKT